MQELIEKIDNCLEDLGRDLALFKNKERGWKVAAARARKATLELDKLNKEFRKASVEEAKKKD